jgi:hypothetical protein
MAKLTLDTDKQFDDTLAELVKTTGGTEADVLQRAVATYRFLKEQDRDPTKKVSITQNGAVLNDVTLP